VKYQTLDDIPNQLKARIAKLNQPDVEKWVLLRLPALDNKSVIETLNAPDGEKKVIQMLDRMSEFISFEE
jgi:hypothetical protein